MRMWRRLAIVIIEIRINGGPTVIPTTKHIMKRHGLGMVIIINQSTIFFATNLNTKTHTVFSVNSNDLTKKVQTFCLVAMREKKKPTFQSHCIVCVHIHIVLSSGLLYFSPSLFYIMNTMTWYFSTRNKEYFRFRKSILAFIFHLMFEVSGFFSKKQIPTIFS